MSADQPSDETSRDDASTGQFGFWEVDVRDMALTLSDAAREIYGLGPAACRLGDMLRLVHPDERRRVSDEVHAALRAGTRLDVGYRIVAPTGEHRQVCVRAEPLGADGGPARYVGTVQEVSE